MARKHDIASFQVVRFDTIIFIELGCQLVPGLADPGLVDPARIGILDPMYK
jgi:hypothetical protein